MVSKVGHCLNDLLFRQPQLGMDIPLIIFNHPDFAPLAATYSIPFHHLPVTAATKAEQDCGPRQRAQDRSHCISSIHASPLTGSVYCNVWQDLL
jgi:formyltetrahydrofolate hydrolase